MQGFRRFELVSGSQNGGLTQCAPIWLPVPTAGRSVPIVVGRFVVQLASGDSSTGVDGALAADTTGTPGRLLMGLVHKVTNSKGGPLDRAYLGTSDAGGVEIWPVRGNLFRGTEDAQGGALAAGGGHCALILGTVSGYTDQITETNYVVPYPNDLIDSSTASSGTSANRAFYMLRRDPDVLNQGVVTAISAPAIAVGAYNWLFRVNDAFSVEVA